MDDERARVYEAAGQLLRYGGSAADDRLIDVLDLLTTINDDIAHGRHKSIVVQSCEMAAELLRAVASEYEA